MPRFYLATVEKSRGVRPCISYHVHDTGVDVDFNQDSLVPRLHCPAFFALLEKPCVFPKCKKNTGQWSLETRFFQSA